MDLRADPAALLASVAERTGIHPESSTLSLGSGALLFWGRDGRQAEMVGKVVEHATNVVDGHTVGDQLKRALVTTTMRRRSPLLAKWYSDDVSIWAGPDWVATAVPRYEGEDLLRRARCGYRMPIAELLEELQREWGRNGYEPLPREVAYEAYASRVRRRITYLLERRYLDGPLERLAETAVEVVQESLLSRLPRSYGGRVHGDLNTANIIWRADGSFNLIDPGTSLSLRHDVIYDIAKLAFSALVWDWSLRSSFDVHTDGVGAVHIGWREAPPTLYDTFYTELFEWVESVFGAVGVAHLLVATAAHSLAEAACRISVGESLARWKTVPTSVIEQMKQLSRLYLVVGHALLTSDGRSWLPSTLLPLAHAA